MELTITGSNFEAEVINSDVPVLVDFYADWCGPCRMMAPLVSNMAEKYEGKLKVGKCNVDNENELAMRFNIMSIPALIVFKNGEAVKKSIGAIPEQELEALLAEIL